MTESDEGLDACTDDLAIQQLVVATQQCCLEKGASVNDTQMTHRKNTHLRSKQTRVSLVTVAGLTESSPWETFPRVRGIPDRQVPMTSSPQNPDGQK